MADLDLSIQKTLRHEGIYSNDPDDPGGETWRGIARKFHPDWPGWTIIDAAKARGVRPEALKDDPALQTLVLTFYREKFAHTLYSQIDNQEVLDELFDFGFNVNKPNAVNALQESLRALVVGPVIVDGKFGPQTLAAINAVEPKRLLDEFRARQAGYYVEAILRRFVRILSTLGVSPSPDILSRATKYAGKYALGWMRRVIA
jgi:lysozyme family protein